MTASSLRLAFKLHRFESAAFGIIILAPAAAAFVVAGWLDATGYGRLCLTPTTIDNQPPVCQAMGRSFYDLQSRLAGPIATLLLLLSYAAAALVGVALVAREIERGTARLAWSLAPSRRRWYATRVVPILALLVGMTFIAGIATDRLTGASEPRLDLANAFANFGARGGLVAARSVFVFAVAVLAGTLLGRTLPALIVATVVAGAGLTGGEEIHNRIIRGEGVVVASGQERPGDMWIDQEFQLPDGRLVGWEVMEQLDPPQPDVEWIPRFPMMSIVVPGERYRFTEAREAAALAGGSILALGLGGFVVGRRRPD